MSGRLTPESKATITLAGVGAIFLTLAGFLLWFSEYIRADAVRSTTVDMRLQRLEDEKCPCREFFQRAPPELQR